MTLRAIVGGFVVGFLGMTYGVMNVAGFAPPYRALDADDAALHDHNVDEVWESFSDHEHDYIADLAAVRNELGDLALGIECDRGISVCVPRSSAYLAGSFSTTGRGLIRSPRSNVTMQPVAQYATRRH